MTHRFGLSVALATPVDGEGHIAIEPMIGQARRCLVSGCNSVTLFGTTGEGCSVGAGERQTVLDAMLAAGIPAERIVMGVLVDAVEDAVTQAAQALQKGVGKILLAPPSYFKNVSDEGVFGWFSAVFRGLGSLARDVILYNIPSVTMVPLSLELVGRLRDAFPHIVAGVKDSSGDWPYTERLLGAHSDLIILIGDERHLAQGVRLGGQGAISGMANFLPAEIGVMAREGVSDPKVESFVLDLLDYPVTPAVKAMIALVTDDEGWLAVRPPLVPVSQEEYDRLAASFKALFRHETA